MDRLGAHRWRPWSGIVPRLGLLANTSHCLGTLSLSLQSPLYFSIHIPFLGWNTPLFLLCSGLSPVSVPINSWQQKKQTEAGDFMLSSYRHWPHGFAEGQTSEAWMEESAAAAGADQGPTWLPVCTSVILDQEYSLAWYGWFKINQKWVLKVRTWMGQLDLKRPIQDSHIFLATQGCSSATLFTDQGNPSQRERN